MEEFFSGVFSVRGRWLWTFSSKLLFNCIFENIFMLYVSRFLDGGQKYTRAVLKFLKICQQT